MDHQFFEKRCHYSIRKFAIGAASVMVGASIFGASMVQAAETEPALEAETSLTQLPPEDKLSPELAGAIKDAEADLVSETKVEEVATKSQAPEETSSKPVETKNSTVEKGVTTVENASTEVAPTETNAVTEPTKPAEVNGTVEKADSFTADKPASKAEIDAAKSQVAKKEYTVFPRPQKVTYGDGVTALEGKVNLVFSDGLDIYTRNRAKEVLQASNVSYTTSTKATEGATNIFLGVRGKAPLAEKEVQDISSDLYDKIDAYVLRVKDNKISIVGKDTDAVFFGLTTLKQMLKESSVPVLRDVTVEDYAEVKNRGFIEGYYGNPWTKENREELMRYGGDLKLTQYFFAPKDDPYHNAKWRELYPEEKMSEIRDLARVGNETKTRYVWTIHPFMHNKMRFDTDELYKQDLDVIKAKFTQLLDAGVREFGVLADDAAWPVGGYNSYVRLMTDLTNWLTEQETKYSGLRKDMIFVPAWYMGQGTEDELRTLNERLPETVHLTLTGGKVWGAVDQTFLTNLKKNLTEGGKKYRPIHFWINWPCNDNTKQHLILGGGEKFLHPNVDLSLAQGIMLNPMQQSEASKVALFDVAQYGWKQWRSAEEAEKINDMAFNYVVNGNFEESDVSKAFRELGKHMRNQNRPPHVTKLEESVELAPKLTDFYNKLKTGQNVDAERKELKGIFANLKADALLLKEKGDKKLIDQIHYWLDNTVDQMDALEALLTATEGLAEKNDAKVWEHYYAGVKYYDQSISYSFFYVDHYERAEFGVQHIRPFINNLKEYLATHIQTMLHPDKLVTTFITNRAGIEGGLAEVTDGDLDTHAIVKTTTVIERDDYVGLRFNKSIKVHTLGFATGTKTADNYTFGNALVEYQNEQGDWVALTSPAYTGRERTLEFTNLDITAQAVRMRATAKKDNAWLAMREIAVNRPLELGSKKVKGTITLSPNLVYKYGTSVLQMQDGKDNTESMMAHDNQTNVTPENAWVQMDLGGAKKVKHVHLVQGESDKLAAGIIEYSTDGTNWKTLQTLAGDRISDISQNFTAQYVRVRNTQLLSKWWRIADFRVDVDTPNTDLTVTNVDSLKETPVVDSRGSYEMTLPQGTTLPANGYLGLKLDRLHEAKSVALKDAGETGLTLEYSANEVEWMSADQLPEHALVRYVRIVNKTDKDQALPTGKLVVKTKEVDPTELLSTTMGIHQYYGANDVRRVHNLGQLFDGDFNNFVEFSDYQRKNGEIVMKLGTARHIKKIRAYIQDAQRNYLRDGKIQVSEDGKNWTDVVTVGDGVENEIRDNSLTDGWTHDSANPGNRYIEGILDQPVTAKFMRVLFTADYNARFVGFSEIVINDGEFINPENNPTVTGNGSEAADNLKKNMTDGNVLTSYAATEDKGELVYHLSEETKANHVRLIADLPEGAKVNVQVRTLNDAGESVWKNLGEVRSSFQTFALSGKNPRVLDVKVSWEGGEPEFYEMTTFYQEVENDPAPTTSKGDEPAPVVEVPEFEGGVNAVEAAKHELPEYTEAVGTAGEDPAPVVEVPEFKGGVNAVEAAKNELPEYTEAVGTVGDDPAPVVEVPEFEGGVNAVEAAKNELPEYTEAIGTVGDAPAPVVKIPEFKGGVNAVEAAKNELPEYTGTVATVGNKPAPSLVKPAEEVRILSDKETGVLVAGLTKELSKDLKLQVQKVLRQELAGKHYDAYKVKLLDKDNQEVELEGAVLVRLPVKGQVQEVYHMSLDQGLQVQKVTLVGDMVEFVTKDLGLYAIVYKEQNQEPVKPVEQAHEPAVKGENFENASEKVDSARLPKTGESRSDTAAFLASLSLVLSVALLTVKRKEK